MSSDYFLVALQSKKYVWVGQWKKIYNTEEDIEKLKKFLFDTTGEEIKFLSESQFDDRGGYIEILSSKDVIEKLEDVLNIIKEKNYPIEPEVLNILLRTCSSLEDLI